MAITASNFTNIKRRPFAAGAWRVTGKFTGPTSYASGGEILTNTLLHAVTGLNHVELMNFGPGVDVTNNLGLDITFDYNSTTTTQGNIRCFQAGGSAADGATEMTATHNLSTYTAKFDIVGV